VVEVDNEGHQGRGDDQCEAGEHCWDRVAAHMLVCQPEERGEAHSVISVCRLLVAGKEEAHAHLLLRDEGDEGEDGDAQPLMHRVDDRLILECESKGEGEDEEEEEERAAGHMEPTPVELPLFEEELVDEAVHERVEEHRRGVLVGTRPCDELHDVPTSISAGVDALQIEREARHWAPYPQRLTLLAQHVTKHTVIAQPRRQLHAGEVVQLQVHPRAFARHVRLA